MSNELPVALRNFLALHSLTAEKYAENSTAYSVYTKTGWVCDIWVGDSSVAAAIREIQAAISRQEFWAELYEHKARS